MIVGEDEEPLRLAIADLIAGESCFDVVGTAADADAAIELARTLQPDVALLDVRMPHGGGARAAREIARLSPGTKSIALSAYEDRKNVLEMLRSGAIGYIVKGVAPAEILDAVHRAVREQSSLSAKLVADIVGDVARDVAERFAADEIVRNHEERFQLLLEAAPDAVAIVHADGTVLLVNERTVELFGYTRHELVGLPIELLLPARFREVHVRLRTEYFAESRLRPMGSGRELTGLHKDGSEFPLDIALTTTEGDNGRVVTAFMRDLSERHAADAILRKDAKHFEALLESAPDAVVIVDGAGRIFYVNELTERLFRYSRHELLDQPVEMLFPEGFHELQIASRAHDPAGQPPRAFGASHELTALRKHKVELSVDVSLSGIETSDGLLVAAFVRDATDRKSRADIERSIATRQAVLAHLVSAGEDERRQIAADIHDDSIQVVTAAGIRLQILRRALDDPEQLRLLDELAETILLAVSRLRHLLFELRPPVLDHEGLGPALRMYLDVADRHTDTSYHLDDRLTSQPPEATRVILYRIAQEVLTNVRKHSAASNVTVTLKERDGGYHVRIVDDGVGFVPDASARPGHLGIPAVRERAELAGGWLRVASKPGDGTTVEFWIAPEIEAESSATPARPVELAL